jgi:DNA-binding transcriptional LysR family regulator
VNPLEWNDLHLVVTLARTKTLGAAARRLSVSPATVSRRLAAIEESLGQRLFERTAAGLLPEPTVLELVAHAQRVEAEMVDLMRRLRSTRDRVEGVVSVTCSAAVATAWVSPMLAAMLQTWPDLNVRLVEEQRVISLEQGDADIAIRLVRPQQQRLVAQRLGTIPFGWHASLEYLEQHPQGLGDGTGHWAIGYDASLPMPETQHRMRELPGAQVRVQCFTLGSQIAAARDGAGLVLAPELAHLPGLVRVASSAMERDVWLVAHENARDRPAVRVVWDELRQAIRAHLNPSSAPDDLAQV